VSQKRGRCCNLRVFYESAYHFYNQQIRGESTLNRIAVVSIDFFINQRDFGIRCDICRLRSQKRRT
jgi:hypothetical protein